MSNRQLVPGAVDSVAALVICLDHASHLARDLADYLAAHRASDRARDLAAHLARDLASYATLDLARDLATHRASARALAADVSLDRGRARDLAASLGGARYRYRARDLARDLANELEAADDLARDLAANLEAADDLARRALIRGRGKAPRVVPMAGRLLAVAARLLPARERARYAEEFRSELWEIAQEGGGRGVQLAYAARQLMSTWRLRAELRVPQRRGAAP